MGLAPLFLLEILGRSRLADFSKQEGVPMAKVTDMAEQLAAPIAAANGCGIWDVEYVKEAGSWYLRVYLDHPEGVTIDHCEAVSRALDVKLDEVDPIEGSYVLEVSSPGADRVLRKPEHFERFMGQKIEVRLYRPRDGAKSLVGELKGYNQGDVTVQTAKEEVTVPKQDIAQVRLYITF